MVNTLKRIDFGAIDQIISYSDRAFFISIFAVIAKFYLHEQIRKNNTVGHVAPMGAVRNVHTILVGIIDDSSWMT